MSIAETPSSFVLPHCITTEDMCYIKSQSLKQEISGNSNQ